MCKSFHIEDAAGHASTPVVGAGDLAAHAHQIALAMLCAGDRELFIVPEDGKDRHPIGAADFGAISRWVLTH